MWDRIAENEADGEYFHCAADNLDLAAIDYIQNMSAIRNSYGGVVWHGFIISLTAAGMVCCVEKIGFSIRAYMER